MTLKRSNMLVIWFLSFALVQVTEGAQSKASASDYKTYAALSKATSLLSSDSKSALNLSLTAENHLFTDINSRIMFFTEPFRAALVVHEFGRQVHWSTEKCLHANDAYLARKTMFLQANLLVRLAVLDPSHELSFVPQSSYYSSDNKWGPVALVLSADYENLSWLRKSLLAYNQVSSERNTNLMKIAAATKSIDIAMRQVVNASVIVKHEVSKKHYKLAYLQIIKGVNHVRPLITFAASRTMKIVMASQHA